MSSFEEPKREVREMVIPKPEINEKEWREMLERAFNFVESTFAFDIFEGIREDELEGEELREYQILKKVLGRNVIDGLAMMEFGTISGGGAPPPETIKKDREAWQKEKERVLGLTPKELIREAENWAADGEQKQ